MKNKILKSIVLLLALVVITLSFFALKIYFIVQEEGNYSGEFLNKDILYSFIYAIGPFLISIITFRKKIFNT